ncbi:hypothetical protein [uncultured Duncaniella sp.]|uniref:hypothetical protein n=1 Tax=uncultured Duncaniella sp. TaxID=2768039 RepID=UPI00260D65ED|nr:hypothetical protein [uncultured Duncaniella sp.]
MITKRTRRQPVQASRGVQPSRPVAGRGTPITAGISITSQANNRQGQRQAVRQGSRQRITMAQLSPERQIFCRQLQANTRQMSRITAATNTTNIFARPDFMELLPMFVQKLIILDVFGSVAMKSRQQLIPYFKFVAENDKGATHKGDIINSPMVNRQGVDPDWTSRVVKGETVAEGDYTLAMGLCYTPVLPGSVTLSVNNGTSTAKVVDDSNGNLVADGTVVGYINYSNGDLDIGAAKPAEGTGYVKATYQYDNENVGPDEAGQYGAKMAKGHLQLDEINLVAEAHQLACYWSLYSAFAAATEYGANLNDMAKEAAFSELTAEINSSGFVALRNAAMYSPQYNWDCSPVVAGSVVPSDYLNMFKLKLGQAAASIYQTTRLTRPNRLIVGTQTAEYISMIQSFKADNIEDTVGPYKFGTLDQFEVYVEPAYDPTEWVMSCKSSDIRRNSGLFGEYMPMTNTDAIGLANASIQQGYAWMGALNVVNPATIVRGKILGGF